MYCNERCHPFKSLEAVKKHMEDKSHCEARYGDRDEDEEVELEEFYDYSSRYWSYYIQIYSSDVLFSPFISSKLSVCHEFYHLFVMVNG